MDELEEVTQKFTADVTEYEADVEEAVGAAQEFATANEEAQTSLDGMKDSAATAGTALGTVRDAATEAAAAQDAAGTSADGMRDHLAEVAAAAGIYTDAMGKLRDAQGKFVSESTVEDLALGHTRDEALEAAAAFKKLRDEQSKGSGSSGGSLLKDLEGGVGGGGSGSGGGEAGGAGGAGGLLGNVPLLVELLPVLLPLIMAALTEVAALATGFVAAGLGVGSFVALALPAFKQVFGALGDTKAQLEKLPEPVQQAVAGVKGLKSEFTNMSKAFEPTAFTVLNQGLKIAGQLLPFVGQFATAAAPAIEQVLNGISKFVGSPNFKDFMARMAELGGKVITAVGSGLGGLLPKFMQIMNLFSDKDVVNAFNIAFRVLGFAVDLVTGLIMESMGAWDWLTQTALPNAGKVLKTAGAAFTELGHAVTGAFDIVRHAVATGAHDIADGFDTIRHTAAAFGDGLVSTFTGIWDVIQSDTTRFVSDVVSFFTSLPGKILNVLASLPGKLVQYGKDLVNGLIQGVESMGSTLLNAIESLIPGPIKSVVSTALGIFSPSTVFHGFGVNIVQGLINGVQATVPALRAAMGHVTGAVSGPGSALAAGAVAPAGGSTSVHVSVPVTAQGMTPNYNDPRFTQYIQGVVQEGVLRYGQLNPGNGLITAWGR